MPIAQATPAIKLSAGSDSSGSSQDGATTPRAPITSSIPRQLAFPSSSPPSDDLQTQQHRIRDEEEAVHASTPLLANDKQRYDTFVSPSLDSAFDSPSTPPQHFYTSPHPGIPPSTKDHVIQLLLTTRQYITPKAFATGVGTTIEAFPAILLGLLLNVLDGVSYGFIMFPAGPVFAGFGPMGVSMFFLTTLISQLVYSFGGSSFPGASASMIIEVIPFFHILANEIVGMLGEENVHAIVATTMVAFALSSIITGLTFLLLGVLKLGSIIGFFPRHILVGCIGGVGVFLIQTGLSVCAGLGEEDSDFTWSLLKIYFTDTRILTLWVPAFTLAALLRVITHRYHHQLIFPLYFVALPIIFYLVVLAGGFDVSELREAGWVFNVGEAREPWYQFYTLFDFRAVSWRAIWATMPTQLALLFFNILHPPLNVPALGVSLGKDDVDLNRELVGHGVSNLIAGAFGTPSNYLAYVNTLLFYRVGGTTRYAGFLLALATFGLLLIGTGPIAYIPVLEVGALIFVLGIDLVKEAVWDPWPRTSRSEYITIIGIMACMTVYDFVSGVLFGIILACVFFVIQNSQRHSIRNIYSGATALSPVRRPSAHRKYLQEVGTQTSIMRLQGPLIFCMPHPRTISKVEETCRAILEQHAWERNPIRFLVIDLALVGGLDLSAAEAFVRVQRLLVAKQVILVFCGQPPDSDVATALQAVGLWSGSAQTFASLNEALEWTENAYLRAWYASPGVKNESPPRAEHQPIGRSLISYCMTRRAILIGPYGDRESSKCGPSLHRGNSTLLKEQPFNTIVKTFSAHLGLNDQFVARIVPYFKAQALAEGEVVYRQGDKPDGLYLVESGVLKCTYAFADHVPDVVESCVAGTLSGELTALAGEPRNATVVAERQSILWKMTTAELARLEKDNPEDANLFVKLVLKTSKIDQDVLLTNLAQFRM
ncbi:hypothetical protein DL93DRAFT_2052151 [Clavulina sp. PMI_390]|nr:hypothetical protein DL93DRAFT_2052151 [Clavulina sp. PMI_390]